MTEDHGVVVVGAGQAAQTLIETLRAEGYAGAITLVGEEPERPYQRPPLSKAYLLGEMARDRLFLKPEAYFAEMGVTMKVGARAVGLDRAARRLTLESGETLAYGRLALVTGARARSLPAAIGGALAGVFTVRTLGDVERLGPALAAAKAASAAPRLGVIGAGYVGLEAAAAARKLGFAVTVLEAAPRILARTATAEAAAEIASTHAAYGVEILAAARLAAIEADAGGAAAALRLEDGRRIPVSLVVAGVGAAPNDGLAAAAGLETRDGILVDETCRASDPDVVSAGDCARFAHAGGDLRLESVQNAIDGAKAAARALLGRPEPYRPTPWFWSDQYDLKLQIAGLVGESDERVLRAGARPGARSIWSFRAGRLQAVEALNDPPAYLTAKRWLEAGRSPRAEDLRDAARALKEIDAV